MNLQTKVKIEEETAATLNPEWVSRMMGFPAGWLELGEPKNGKEESPELQLESKTEQTN